MLLTALQICARQKFLEGKKILYVLEATQFDTILVLNFSTCLEVHPILFKRAFTLEAVPWKYLLSTFARVVNLNVGFANVQYNGADGTVRILMTFTFALHFKLDSCMYLGSILSIMSDVLLKFMTVTLLVKSRRECCCHSNPIVEIVLCNVKPNLSLATF